VPISKKLGSDGKLYSFEMSGKMTERLKKNLRENSCSNVTVKNNPLSDTVDETVSFEEIDDHSKSNFGDIRINKENKGVKATTTTIDNTNINRPVSFIKVDCQGYDLKVMKGAKKTIEKYRPVVIFEWEEEMSQVFGDTLEDVFDFFEDLDYEVNRIHKDDWIARPIK
jgi:FkbM family methyltransferase